MNKKVICTTCGTQYDTVSIPLEACPICSDDRQYIPESGQGWTNLEELSGKHGMIIKCLNHQLYELKVVPTFAIGQRALLVTTPNGNILWDCIALLNQSTIDFIHAKGGLKAIAFSHPHYYTTMNEWAEVFQCPIYIHQNDKQWVYHKGRYVSLWNGTEKLLWDGMKLINVGGHFPGSSVLHVPFLSSKGAILCGDTFYISLNKKHMAPMFSYPNRIPLPLSEIQRIRQQVKPIEFDAMYGFYDDQNILYNASVILEESLKRYV
jgi:hypothetical protein